MAVVQTKMAMAFVQMAVKAQAQVTDGKLRLDPSGRKIMHRVLTNTAQGVGTKWETRKKRKAVSAEGKAIIEMMGK